MAILVLRSNTDLDTDEEMYPENLEEICNSEPGHCRNNCELFPPNLPAPVMIVERPKEQVDYMEGGFFMVSERMKDLLDSYHVHAQYIQCEMITEDRTPAESVYYYCNILESVDCFDYEKSKYKREENYIQDISHMVLREEVAQGKHLFLLGPTLIQGVINPNVIGEITYCVSEELAADILQRGFTNIAFTLPGDRDSYPTSAVAWSPGK